MPKLFKSDADFWQFMFFATVTLIAIFVIGTAITQYHKDQQPADQYGAISSGVRDVR